MPRIPQFFFQQQQARQATAGQPSLAPGMPRVSLQAAGMAGQAATDLGAATAEAGGALDASLRAFNEAKGALASAEAFNTFLLESEQRQAEVLASQDVFPLDFAQTFSTAMQSRLQELGATVPQSHRGQFVTNAARQMARLTRDLQAEGRKRFIERGEQAYNQTMEQLLQGVLAADNDIDRQGLRQSMREITGMYVEQGMLTAEQGSAKLQGLRTAEAVTRMELFARTEPQAALAQLLEGPKANPNIPIAALPKLIDEANLQYDKQLQREERVDRRAKEKLAEQQDTLASQYRTRVHAINVTQQELRQLEESINNDRAAGNLSEEDHSQLTRSISGRFEAMRGRFEAERDRAEKRQSDALRRKYAIMVELANTPADFARAQESVIADAGGMEDTDVAVLMQRITSRRDSSHFLNLPAYRSSVERIKGRAFPIGMTAIVQESLEKGSPRLIKLNDALDAYRTTMEQIYQQEGAAGVTRRAAEEERKISDIFFPRDISELSDPEQALPPVPSSMQGVPYLQQLETLETLEVPAETKALLYDRIRRDEEKRKAGLKAIEGLAPQIEKDIRDQPSFLERLPLYNRFFGQ